MCRPLTIQNRSKLTLELDGSNDVDLHDGLENNGSTFRESFTESTLSGESESQFGRIDLMSSSVFENKFTTRDRVTSEDTSLECVVESLSCENPSVTEESVKRERKKAHFLNRRNVSSGNVSSDNVRFESGILSGSLIQFHRFDSTDDFTILTGTSRLFLVSVSELDRFSDGFTESDTRFAGDTLDVVLSLHTLDVDVEVELTHSGDDSLRGEQEQNFR